MRLMPNIKLTEEQIKRLLVRYRICRGGEATICSGDSYGTVYKIFENNGQPRFMSDNKRRKVIELYKRDLEYSVKPLSTISYDGGVIGYSMTTDYDFETYKTYQLSRAELIQFLKESRVALEYFANEGIVYGDVAPRNILFNVMTGEVLFCDMDNTQIGNYKIDKMPTRLLEYQREDLFDTKANAFMHNHMTLSALDLDAYCSFSWDIRKQFERPAQKVIKAMSNSKNFNGEYIVDYLKKCR